eukprot:1672881-Prymnesium_polylepis.1
MGTCCSKTDDEPLRPRGGISSDDPHPQHEERSAAQIEAEAARAQEWCLEHMTLEEPDAPIVPVVALSSREVSSWVPADAEAEVETELAADEALPKLEGLAPAALIRQASKLPGTPTMLAVARLVSESAPADAP